MPCARSVATQVCRMNSRPTSSSDSRVAPPIARAPSRLSSASVEMPSKPRKDRTAIDVAPAIVAIEKAAGSYTGFKVSPPAPWPPYSAARPIKTNSASVASSKTSKYKLTRTVRRMPIRLTPALKPTKPMIHAQSGTPGQQRPQRHGAEDVQQGREENVVEKNQPACKEAGNFVQAAPDVRVHRARHRKGMG